VLSSSCDTRVLLSMLIGWHSNRVVLWLPFSRELHCERVGPRCESFLRLIRAVTVGNLTTRLTVWLPDELFCLPQWASDWSTNFSLWSTCWATALSGLHELTAVWLLHKYRTLCVKTGRQYFRVARISETAKRVEVWTKHPDYKMWKVQMLSGIGENQDEKIRINRRFL